MTTVMEMEKREVTQVSGAAAALADGAGSRYAKRNPIASMRVGAGSCERIKFYRPKPVAVEEIVLRESDVTVIVADF